MVLEFPTLCKKMSEYEMKEWFFERLFCRYSSDAGGIFIAIAQNAGGTAWTIVSGPSSSSSTTAVA
jgi:hypothetical protein